MYYVNMSDLSAVEPAPSVPSPSLFPQVSDSTKRVVVYGAIGLVAVSFLIWLATRK
jgi:hypothetical protein